MHTRRISEVRTRRLTALRCNACSYNYIHFNSFIIDTSIIRLMHKGLVDKNQILAIAVVSLISTMLLSIGFAATVNVTAQPGSMATLQNIPATYAVSIVPGRKRVAFLLRGLVHRGHHSFL